MKSLTSLIACGLLFVVASPSWAAPPADEASKDDSPGLSFRYDKADSKDHATRVYTGEIAPRGDVIFIYATIVMGPANPLRLVDGVPEWSPAGTAAVEVPLAVDEETALGGFVIQEQKPIPDARPQFLETIALGTTTDGKFVPALKFGLGDDRRAEEMLHVTPWVWDGKLDHFAPYARPNTPYDFKMQLDLKRRRVNAWIGGRGDDDWFLLLDEAPLFSDVKSIDRMQVEVSAGGPPIQGLKVLSEKWEGGEAVRPHPLAKKNRVVDLDRGFRFQSLRSTWRQPGKHVTIFREPGVHAGFPDVAQAGPDHLVCVWRNGSHTGGTGGLSVAHSYDLGKSWGEPKVVTQLGANCPRLQRMKDGNLLLLVDVPRGGNQFVATWDLYLWDSIDGGETWINERKLDVEKVGGGGCIVPSRIAELADGSWLLAASYFAEPKHGGRYVEILDYYRTTDRGSTWEFLGQPYHYPPHCLSEPSPIQLADDRLIVYARESRADGLPGAKGASTDGGKSWTYQELPHPITGRTCAALLNDGRVMNTFRSGVGRAALRAWIGEVDDNTTSQPAGGHFNDKQSVGLKDGILHIDNDGMRGQFTKYTFRSPDAVADAQKTTVDVTFEVQAIENQGRAATVSIPFAGKLRIFPDRVAFAHNPELRVDVTPDQFHTYRVVSVVGRTQIYVDGELKLDTDKAAWNISVLPWGQVSDYALEFGNESKGLNAKADEVSRTMPDVYPANITAEVTGYSLWKSFAAEFDDPQTTPQKLNWSAEKDGFPDQYQLDHIVEVEASAAGHDQGYSGWTQLDDGRIFVVHYTDDASGASASNPHNFGVPWIRGTWLELSDLPPIIDKK